MVASMASLPLLFISIAGPGSLILINEWMPLHEIMWLAVAARCGRTSHRRMRTRLPPSRPQAKRSGRPGDGEDHEGQLLGERVHLARERQHHRRDRTEEAPDVAKLGIGSGGDKTTPVPWPAVTSVPENAIERRSPSGVSAATGSSDFSTGTDSPVRAASWI